MRYSIHRECWNDKTHNGYTDAPYWRVEFSFHIIGLNDDGTFWSIRNDVNIKNDIGFIMSELKTICQECKLKIKLKVVEEV